VTEAVSYEAYAERVVESGIVLDPWLAGVPRLAAEPLVVGEADWRTMARVGEEVAELYDEVCQLVDDDDDVLESFFALTPVQKLMWNAARPFWHGFARADVFETREGHVISELNCDTPTGEPEAVVLGAIARADRPELLDPNASLERRFVDMLELVIERLVDGSPPKTIGIVYPTEFTEDLSVIRLYRRWLVTRGYDVVLGSPYNLGTTADGRATLFDRPLAAILRHYKTDAWGERVSAWSDEELPDALPLGAPLSAALRASIERKTAVVNPFGSVVPQNKRSMAFMWEFIHRFSTRGRSLVERYVPFSSRLETMHPERLLADREGWVLKSDYGAEGDEVVIGAAVDDATWREVIACARPGRWIAQRYFEASSKDGEITNYGVFLVAGEASGLYVRRQSGATDEAAISVPVLVRR
jgi:glutathionylspermidine synthase